jgi:hypothetical protein
MFATQSGYKKERCILKVFSTKVWSSGSNFRLLVDGSWAGSGNVDARKDIVSKTFIFKMFSDRIRVDNFPLPTYSKWENGK